MPETAVLKLSEYIRSLGIRHEDGVVMFAGTGFGFQRPGLVMTAFHVVASATGPDVVCLRFKGGAFVRPIHIEHHPEADIAALVFNPDRTPPCFKLGKPPPDNGEFWLGTEINSYGYPYRNETEVAARSLSRDWCMAASKGISSMSGPINVAATMHLS